MMDRKLKGDWVDDRRIARILEDGDCIRKVIFSDHSFGWCAKNNKGMLRLTDWDARNILSSGLYRFVRLDSGLTHMILPKSLFGNKK